MSVFVCVPEQIYVRRVMDCPRCKAKRRFVMWDSGIYYSPEFTCMFCGTQYCECERRIPRSAFARSKVIKRAKENWKTGISPNQHREWVRSQLEGPV